MSVASFISRNHETIFLAWLMLCAIGILVAQVSAIPVTGGATLVGSNNATLSAINGGVDCWFEYGVNSGNLYWITPNITASGGVFSYTVQSSPITGNTRWYYRACDETGCGAEVSFVTLPVTPIPKTNLGGFYRNITRSGFNIPTMAVNLVGPFLWNVNIPLVMVFMLVFSPIFVGIWLRSRTALVVMVTGFITGSFILYSNSGLNLGVPPEIISVAQAMCYVAFAGAIVYILKR